MEYKEEQPLAKFNAGIAKLMRIDKIKKAIHASRVMDDYDNWYDSLFSWRSEMNGKMKEEERSVADGYELSIGKELGQYGKRVARLKNKGMFNSDNAGAGLNFLQLLKNYELWLGDIEEKKGFGMPDKDGVDDVISQMD